jgi:hypothetical protein
MTSSDLKEDQAKSLDDALKRPVDLDDDADDYVKQQRFLLGVAYMLSMGVCGIVLCAIGSNLKQLAVNCNTTATKIGTVFIARGLGAVTGAIASAKLYRLCGGNNVMIVTLLLLCFLIMSLPLIKDVYLMHAVFALLGTCTSITDTGCQIQTRKVHGIKAGPWLGVNTVVFSVSGAFVPLIALITGNLAAQCSILAAICFIAAGGLLIPKQPEGLPPPKHAFAPRYKLKVKVATGEDSPEKRSCPYVVETLASFEALWLIGGKVSATSYFTTYVDETGVIPAHLAGLLIVMLWVGVSLGRLVGIFDQIGLSTERLMRNVYIQLLMGALGMGLIVAFPKSGPVLWTGVLVYGFFNGPTIGYVYDLCNRTTAASEKGMSIVMFGLNLGASLIPFLTSYMWENGRGPVVLPVVVMASHIFPIPCQYLIGKFTATPAIVTWAVAFRILCGERPSRSDAVRPDETDSLIGPGAAKVV